MPPRHTYWTILFGNQPTAFRSAEREELLPTFKQIQAKHPDAVMRWFARGRLWKSPEEARDTFDRPRYDRPRDDRGPRPESQGRSAKPAGDWRDKPQGDRSRRPKPEWHDKAQGDRPKPAWQHRGPKPEWRDKPQGDRPKPAWQHRGPKPEWRDKPQGDRPPRDPRAPRPPASARPPNKTGYGEASPPASPKSRRDEGGKPRSGGGGAWQNRGPKPPRDRPPSQDQDKRGRDWRPGGAHQDPRDRFKVPRDVKRARFKQNLQRERTNPRPPRKKKDEE